MVKYFVIIFQTVINTVAQVLLKRGVSCINFDQPILGLFFALITNVYIIGGTFVFVFSLFTWLYLLSEFDLSFLYPVSSLSFITSAFAGWLFLSETISLNRGIGISLIMLGVIFIAKS